MSTRKAVRHRSWPVPAARLGLRIIPLAAGALRLVNWHRGGRRAVTAGATS